MSGQLFSDRSSFRAIGNPYQGYQEKRRRDALLRQKVARLQSANRARTLALEDEREDDASRVTQPHGIADGEPRKDEATEDEEMAVSYDTAEHVDGERGAYAGPGGRRHGVGTNRRREKQRQSQQPSGGVRAYGLQYGNEMMQPEWMTDVPLDLASNWLVMPRPEGLRCLLVTARGRTVSWLRNGAPLHRFHSPLPGGSPATVGGCGAAAATATGDYCILDCIFHQPNNTYYIQDLLCWRGYALYDCAAEFRAFWLSSKLQEEEILAALQAPCPPALPHGLAPAPAPTPTPAPAPVPAPTPAPTPLAAPPQLCPGAAGVSGQEAAVLPTSLERQVQQQQQQRDRRGGGGGGGGRGRGRGGGRGQARGGGGGRAGSPGAEDVEMGDGDPAGAGPHSTARREQQQGQGCGQQPTMSYRIVPLPVWPCNLQGLRAAYGSGSPEGHPATCAGAAIAAATTTTTTTTITTTTTTITTTMTGVAAEVASEGPHPGAWAPQPPQAAAGGDPPGAAGAESCCSQGDVDFLRDGLYFLHRQGHYCLGPSPTPLALLWKDLGCSRYLVDTDSKGAPLEHQLVVLAFRADRTVATEDDPPVVLGRLPEAFVAALGDKIQPGRLLRFSIRQGGIVFHQGRPAGADLHYEGFANQRRGRADSFSKILFQRLARTAPITVQALKASIEADVPGGALQEMTVEEDAPAEAAGGGRPALGDGGGEGLPGGCSLGVGVGVLSTGRPCAAEGSGGAAAEAAAAGAMGRGDVVME